MGVKGVGRPRVAGAAYGAAGALRTVRTWYAPDDARPFYAGRLASVRDEDGSLRVYDYRVEDERWIETVTTLHEQAPEPVSGRTTRSATVYDRVGNVVERNQEAFIDGTWHLIDRTIYEHNVAGQVTKETDFAGPLSFRTLLGRWVKSPRGESDFQASKGLLLALFLRPYRGRPRTLKGFDPDPYRVSPSTTIVVDLGPL